MEYRSLVTGSRDWTDRVTLVHVLDMAYESAIRDGYDRFIVVHGACPKGADLLASMWARSMKAAGHPVEEERHPADWKRLRRRAGFKRNEEMVELGANLCCEFAMPCSKSNCTYVKPHLSHGTTHCSGLAEAAGIGVIHTTPRRVVAR